MATNQETGSGAARESATITEAQKQALIDSEQFQATYLKAHPNASYNEIVDAWNKESE